MHDSMLVAVLALFVGYCFWRLWRLRRGAKRLMPELPPPNQLSWRHSRTSALALRENTRSTSPEILPPLSQPAEIGAGSSQKAGKPDFFSALATDPLTWAAGADGAIAGWSIMESALKIDPQVLSAMEFSTAQDLHGLADFHTYVQDHFFSTPFQSADGWFNRLTGYVAEQKAASFFEQAGHHVVFAPVSNQPVWDMLVDGHAVQIKENLAGIKDFAIAHPDIPLYTNLTDAATVHESSVHGLSVLDKDSIHAGTSGTIDGLDGTFDPGFSFPFITLAFSVYRESKLLFNEHTSLERALLNVGMDVVGVGGGALLGGKVGALIGSIFPVAGTVIGGILGSLIGAIGGKMTATGVRKMDFYAARDEYNKTVQSAKVLVESTIRDSQTRVRDLQEKYQKQFKEHRKRIESITNLQITAKRVQYDGALLDFCMEFPKFVQELNDQLKEEEREVLAALPTSGILGTIFPTEVDLRRHAIRIWFRRARGTLGRELRKYGKMEPTSSDVLFPAITNFLREFSFELQSLEGRVNDLATALETQKREAEEIRRIAVSEIEGQREELIRQFRVQVTSLHETIVHKIQDRNLWVSRARDNLRKEAAAVGINI
jgi:F0F1-type ATP synthase membrane subunit b/b'